jgi:hypothetical protein
MKSIKPITAAVLATAFAVAPFNVLAQDKAAANKPEKAKPYPLDVCLVSQEELGSMGAPHVFVVDGREIQLCCKGCVKEFEKNKQQLLTKVDEAAKKVKPYKLETCLVSDEKLGSMGEPYVLIRKGQEVKLCCKGCLKEFNKNHAQLLKKLDTASK